MRFDFGGDDFVCSFQNIFGVYTPRTYFQRARRRRRKFEADATATQAHSQVLVRCIQQALQKARSGSIVPHPQGCCASLVVQDLGYACVENHGRVGSIDVLAEPARQTKAPPTHHLGTISIAFTPSWHTRNQFFFGGCAPRPRCQKNKKSAPFSSWRPC